MANISTYRVRGWRWLLVGSMAVTATVAAGRASAGGKDDSKARPKIAVRSQPSVTTAPGRVMLTAELRGGADDFEEFYCPTVQWEWGDGGKSVQEADCDPWTATTPIQRRFTANHTFQFAGLYRVKITLRKSDRKSTRLNSSH